MKNHEKLVCEFATSLVDKYWDEFDNGVKCELTYLNKSNVKYTSNANKNKALKKLSKSVDGSVWVIVEFYSWTNCNNKDWKSDYDSKFVDKDNSIILLKDSHIRLYNNGCYLVNKVVTQVEQITYEKIK